MPTWLVALLPQAGKFISQRFVHFLVYALLGLLTIGVPYKLFVKDTNKTVIHTDKYYGDTCKKQMFFGCAAAKLKCGIIVEK